MSSEGVQFASLDAAMHPTAHIPVKIAASRINIFLPGLISLNTHAPQMAATICGHPLTIGNVVSGPRLLSSIAIKNAVKATAQMKPHRMDGNVASLLICG